MAKFKNLHLVLQEEQRILFGDDALSTPAEYPATSLGSQKPFIGYTTISGYNTTFPGMGISTIASTDQLVVTVPLAGERATQNYHLVRYDQLQDVIADEASSDWQDSVLSYENDPPGAPSDGDRYIVEPTASGVWTGLEDSIVEWNTASGTWDVYSPNEGFTTFVEDEDKYYVYYNGSWAPMGEGIDHGDLIGLDGDDHTHYTLVDGSRGFTSTVSGTYPIDDLDLATKSYIDDQLASISGLLTIVSGVYYIDHSLLYNLGNDDHTQYVPTDGSRGFTSTVSGVYPVQPYHLVTREYIDGLPIGDNVVSISGTQTITGDKTFDNTLTTFLGDVFFDGITITMSGTTLETEAGAIFNYDSTSTINNAGDTNYTDGSTISYEGGFSEVYASGTLTTHESGSVDIYENGAVLTFSGAEITFEGDVNNIIYEGNTTITVNSGTVINYNDGSVINFNDNSTVTFSGTTIFNTPSYFNDDIFYGDNVISGTGDIYAGNIYAENILDTGKKWGRESVINGAISQAVTFSGSFVSDDYTLIATLTNEVDSPPSIYSTIQGVKTAGGFTTHFSGEIDSDNFILEWYAFKGTQDLSV